jgi:signal transduction histidine kinase
MLNVELKLSFVIRHSLFLVRYFYVLNEPVDVPSLMHLLKRVSRIFYLGTDDTMPFEEVQRTFLFNLFLMIGFPFIIPGIPINFSNGQFHLAFMNCLLLIIYIDGVYVNIKREYLWVRKLTAILATIISMTGPVFFRNGTEYNMLINLMSAVILFDNLSFFIFSVSVIACVTYVRLRDVNPASITAFAKASPYINIIWSQFLYVFCVYAFKYIYSKYQKQLALAFEKLKQSNETKDRILRVVAHDLRTPVGGIAALSRLILDNPDRTDAEKNNYLQIIYQTSTESLNLINELLQGHTEDVSALAVSRTDINGLLFTVTKLLEHRAAEKQQEIVLQQSGEQVFADVDREKIGRVIHNLVSNAVKFTQQGGRIDISAMRKDGQVIVEVRDNGIGIPEQMRSELFQMASPAKRKGTAGERSFGIGLSVCKQIMDAHGGTIWVECGEKQGSVFFLSLPAPAN